MRAAGLPLVLALGCAFAPAQAQPQAQPADRSLPTENVIVTAPAAIPDKQAHDFVKSYTGVSPASGKIARWRTGVCPAVTGLPPSAVKFVNERVRQVAALASAPVGAQACKPNIDIVFTLDPQVLLDKVQAKNYVLLGYHDAAREKALATVTHPVQAWYTTQTADLYGTTHVDDRLRTNGGFYIGNVYIPEGDVEHVTGSRLGDGISSELYHVVIVVDLAKVTGRTVGSLADYAAMLALAQTQSFESCAPVASITNLVSPGCDAAMKADEITGSDLAYLHGLYSIDPRDALMRQKDDIADAMKKADR